MPGLEDTCLLCLLKTLQVILKYVLAPCSPTGSCLYLALVHIYQPYPGRYRHGILQSFSCFPFQASKCLPGQASATSNTLVIYRRMVSFVSLHSRIPVSPSRTLADDPSQLHKQRQIVFCRRFSQHLNRCYTLCLHHS